MSTKRGFTMLELVVVLAIVAVLLAISVGGLTLLRNNILLDQATNDLVSLARTIQNRARNSSVSERLFNTNGNNMEAAVVDGFALFFDTTSSYTFRHCLNMVGTNKVNCDGMEDSSVRLPQYADINIYPLNTTQCRLIFFQRATGTMYTIQFRGGAPLMIPPGDCLIRLTNRVTGTSKDVAFNIANNTIEIR